MAHQTNQKPAKGSWRKRPTVRDCAHCGRQFKAWGPKAPAKCCSRRCGYESRKSKHRAQRNCRHCGVLFWPVNQMQSGLSRLCSKACYNAERAEKQWVMVGCTHCGTQVKRRKSQRRFRKAFCSAVCQQTHISGVNHPLFRGNADPNRGSGWRRRAEEARQRDGHKCLRCGMTQEENGKKLPVDHLVPWRAFDNKDDANDLSNLATLCNGCHGYKTTTVERAWLRGNVQPFRQFVDSLRLEPFRIVGKRTAA